MRVQLPTGRRIEMTLSKQRPRHRRARAAPIFSEVFTALADGDIVLTEADKPVDVDGLALADFHAVRALATHQGVLHDTEITFPCRNCDHALRVLPCQALPVAPFFDAELDDPELDRRLDISTTHEVEG